MLADYPFLTPSPLHGFARLLDLWGGSDDYPCSDSAEAVDKKAFDCDWNMVALDLLRAQKMLLKEDVGFHKDLERLYGEKIEI